MGAAVRRTGDEETGKDAAIAAKGTEQGQDIKAGALVIVGLHIPVEHLIAVLIIADGAVLVIHIGDVGDFIAALLDLIVRGNGNGQAKGEQGKDPQQNQGRAQATLFGLALADELAQEQDKQKHKQRHRHQKEGPVAIRKGGKGDGQGGRTQEKQGNLFLCGKPPREEQGEQDGQHRPDDADQPKEPEHQLRGKHHQPDRGQGPHRMEAQGVLEAELQLDKSEQEKKNEQDEMKGGIPGGGNAIGRSAGGRTPQPFHKPQGQYNADHAADPDTKYIQKCIHVKSPFLLAG